MKKLIKVIPPLFWILMQTTSISAWSEDIASLDLKFERTTNSDPKNAYPNKNVNCELLISKPVDNRLNKDNLGSVGYDRPAVSSQPIDEWLDSVLLGINTIGIKTTKNQESGKEYIKLSSKLNKFYVWNHNLRLYSTIVLEINFDNLSTGKAITKKYRITGSKANMFGADSEFTTTINNTANRLIEQIGIDIESQCPATTI